MRRERGHSKGFCGVEGSPGARFTGELASVFAGLTLCLFLTGGIPAAGQTVDERPDRALALPERAYAVIQDRGDDFDLVPGGERTFSVWVRYFQPQYHAKLLYKLSGPALTGYGIFAHQYRGTIGLWVDGGHPDDFSLQGTSGLHSIGDGKWHHVAFVQQDTLLTGYVDGVEDWSYDIASVIHHLANDGPLYVGSDFGEDIIRFAGHLDDMSFWSRAFSAREIRSLMYEGPDTSAADLIAYWPLNGLTGGVSHDVSGNMHHLEIVGAVDFLAATRPSGPPWTRTWWFYGIIGLLGIGLFYASLRLYALRIERQRRKLEAVVSLRTREVELQKDQLLKQADELQELDRAKNRFFANISHEFRTPLTLSLGPIEDVRSGRYGAIPSEAHRRLGFALIGNRRLLRLVNQLLDLARLEANLLSLSVAQIGMRSYLEGIADAFIGLAERREIAFTRSLPDAPVPVYIDVDRFEEVVGNLLLNAFKFTPSGGRVHLELRAGETPIIRVRDTGPGIPSSKLPFIFDRFYRVDDSNMTEGSGIGLALAREIAEQHGATLDVESTEGFGTTFTIRLKSGAAHFEGRDDVSIKETGSDTFVPSLEAHSLVDLDAEHTEPEDSEDDRTTVLVVDDNDALRAYVSRSLSDSYRILTARDGAEALDLLRSVVPDLILSDVMMPGMDGLALLKEIRKSPETDFIPVILLTARSGVDARVEGLLKGADGYLEKPFNTVELETRVGNLIAQRKRLRMRFAVRVSRPAPSPDPLSADGAFAERVREVVAERLSDETFDVMTLAGELGLDRSSLYRHLVDYCGEAPSALLKRMRLEFGASLLETRTGTVSEIAYAAGFKSVSHFSRSFVDHFGCTPSVYMSSESTPGDPGGEDESMHVD